MLCCENCQWFKVNPDNKNEFICTRFAKHKDKKHSKTTRYMMCGEHKSKD